MKDNTHSRGTIWHIGGEDVHMRIPLLKILQQAGYDVAAVGSAGKLHFEEANIPFHYYGLPRDIHIAADVKAILRLRSLIYKHKPSIVHSFDTKPNIFVPIATLGIKPVQVVRTINGMGNLFSESSISNSLLRTVYRMAQRVAKPVTAHLIFQNEDDRKYFNSQRLSSPQQASLIHGSGINEADFEVVEQSSDISNVRVELGFGNMPVVVMVSRLVQNKGVIEYLQAARIVRKQFPEARFLLVGPSATEGNQAVSEAILDSYRDDVEVLGRRNDVLPILKASDLFVLPSYYREGVPRALLEAAASGLPVIATDMPGCRDVLHNGAVGHLVEPKNAYALSDAIVDILKNSTSWKMSAMNARASVLSEFGLASVGEKHLRLYDQLLTNT